MCAKDVIRVGKGITFFISNDDMGDYYNHKIIMIYVSLFIGVYYVYIYIYIYIYVYVLVIYT